MIKIFLRLQNVNLVYLNNQILLVKHVEFSLLYFQFQNANKLKNTLTISLSLRMITILFVPAESLLGNLIIYFYQSFEK